MNKYNLIDILSSELEIEEFKETQKYKFDGIQIPMIQRDYAQGRENESEVRKRFLNAIFAHLEQNKTLELDFVYGSIKRLDNKNYFIPLDGQQRLTTLFLLFWYIGNRELEGEELKNLRGDLARFTYVTRATARMFCEKLSEIKISYRNNPSEEIENAFWFYDSLKKDPTVKAMLVMLDSIHKMYGSEEKKLFPNLLELKFYILPLNGFGLSDELYIKMNARGKQLTGFENFKADLIKWLKHENNPFKNIFSQEVELNGRKMPYYLSFATKLDNIWTGLFWEYSKLNVEPEDKIVDPYFIRYWNRTLLNSFITNCNLPREAIEMDDIFQKFYGNEGNDALFKYDNFDIYNTLLANEGAIFSIERTLDALAKHSKEIKESIKPSWDINDKWGLFDEKINQRQRILFFAVTHYLANNEFNFVKFKNWIRVVWNIVIDPNIRSVPAMLSAMKLIYQLAEEAGDIYKFLISERVLNLIEKDSQLEEERIKALLFNLDSKWEGNIIEAESHPLFKGNIRFLLPELDNTDLKTFIEFKDVSFKIFLMEEKTLGAPDNYLWLRATLAKSKEVPLPISLSNGQFDNWRYLINNQLINGIQGVIKECIKTEINCIETLEQICNNYPFSYENLWIYHLVNWEDTNGKCLLDYSDFQNVKNYQGRNDKFECVYLFNRTRWTDSNIILSNLRNELVSEILNRSSDISFNWKWGNIQNKYFRGMDIELHRQINDLNFIYFIDRVHIRVGIKKENNINYLVTTDFNDDEKANGWICRKKYDYNRLKSVDEINLLVQIIEEEIFNEKNETSLIHKLKNRTSNNPENMLI